MVDLEYTDLRRHWQCRTIFWNEVDSAIILSFLVTGRSTALTLGVILSIFEDLGLREVLGHKREICREEVPWFEVAEKRNFEGTLKRYMWDQMKGERQNVLQLYQQLEVLFDRRGLLCR